MTVPLRSYTQPGLAIFAGIMAWMMGTMNLIYGVLLLALGHMFALPAFPIWSTLIITLAVVINWALAGGLGQDG